MLKHADGLYSTNCNLNLEKLKASVFQLETVVDKHYLADFRLDYKGTMASPEDEGSSYNLLLHPLPEINALYFSIQSFFNKVQTDVYGFRMPVKYWMQCWYNIFYDGKYRDWHIHGQERDLAWHGFFCVDTHDSKTAYRLNDGQVLDITSQDNLMVMGLNHNQHRTYPKQDITSPRITIGFDIVSETLLMANPKFINKSFGQIADETPQMRNHWMPI